MRSGKPELLPEHQACFLTCKSGDGREGFLTFPSNPDTVGIEKHMREIKINVSVSCLESFFIQAGEGERVRARGEGGEGAEEWPTKR